MKKLFFILFLFIFSGCAEKQAEYFNELKCETEKCIEEKNGFFWAKKNKIENEKECDINFSHSFFNGCKIFTQQKKEEEVIETSSSSADEKEWITVKYRKNGKINISGENFQKLETPDSTVKNAWYDEIENLLLIQLNSTIYQYCEVPKEIWENLSKNNRAYDIYKKNIRGRFDCREFGEVVY